MGEEKLIRLNKRKEDPFFESSEDSSTSLECRSSMYSSTHEKWDVDPLEVGHEIHK
jgi:hypothetical protein